MVRGHEARSLFCRLLPHNHHLPMSDLGKSTLRAVILTVYFVCLGRSVAACNSIIWFLLQIQTLSPEKLAKVVY